MLMQGYQTRPSASKRRATEECSRTASQLCRPSRVFWLTIDYLTIMIVIRLLDQDGEPYRKVGAMVIPMDPGKTTVYEFQIEVFNQIKPILPSDVIPALLKVFKNRKEFDSDNPLDVLQSLQGCGFDSRENAVIVVVSVETIGSRAEDQLNKFGIRDASEKIKQMR